VFHSRWPEKRITALVFEQSLSTSDERAVEKALVVRKNAARAVFVVPTGFVNCTNIIVRPVGIEISRVE
jgi:hypothetical protein